LTSAQTWFVDPNTGAISQRGDNRDDQAGGVLLTDIIETHRNIVVTPVRDASGQLFLISWHIEPGTGHIRRLRV
jgi:hypothetical protein